MNPQRMLPRDRYQVLGAFLTLLLIAIAIAIWNDYRIDQAERRITANTEKAATQAANIAALREANRVQNEARQRDRDRIAENAKTALALCEAAAGARRFWIGVRASTRQLLTDPTLSEIERRSNLRFEEELTKVIKAADDVAHSCDDDHP